MLHNARALFTFDVMATDTPFGRVEDLLFDDQYWITRYLAITTGPLIFGRDVLIAPEAVDGIDGVSPRVSVNLTKQQIEDSPDVATDLPVSRQREVELRQYYNWPTYWDDQRINPLLGTPALPETAGDEIGQDIEHQPRPDPHLRSAREVVGYHIAATDGEIGHVDDLIVDDIDWTIRYLVIDTRNWLPGKKVLIAPSWAERIEWTERLVHVRAERQQVKNSPPFEPDSIIGREYETALHRHYGVPEYWS